MHLIYLTRHPFRFSCKCAQWAQFVHMVNSSNDKELDVSSVHIVHESVHFVHHPQTAVDALRKRMVPQTKQVEIHFVLRN